MNKVIVFALTAAAPMLAQQLVVVSGNGQLLREQFVSTQPMVVRAVDAAGRPVPNAPVTWAITQGQGTLRDLQTTTDADGLARANFLATSIQPGSSYLQSVVTATAPGGSARFFMTTTQTAGQGAGQPIIQVYGSSILRGQAGATIPEAFVAQVASSSGALLGQGIPNVGVRVVMRVNPDSPSSVTAACDAPGGLVLTDARGMATCNLVLGPSAGTASFVANIGEISSSREFGLEVTPGQACSVSVNPATLSFASGGGTASFQVTAVNCPWSATAAASWVSILSGTSGTASGQVTISVTPNSGAARSTLISVGNATVAVSQSAPGASLPLAFATTALPAATAGVSYQATIAASGGQAPYTWAATGLPAGLSLNPSSGLLSGSVATAGTYSIAVTVRDAAGATISQTLSLVVNAAQSPGTGNIAIATTSLPAATLNVPYSQTITATGGCQNPFFGGAPRLEIVSGGLPPGLSTQSAPSGTGILITGTPAQAGSYTFALRASDACGNFVTRDFVLHVSALPAAPPLSSSVQALNFTYQRGSGRAAPEQSFTLTSGNASVAFNATAVSDANWLAVSPASGSTSATLTARVANLDLQPGVYTGTVTITSESSTPLTIPATLTVSAGAALSVAPAALTFEFEAGATVPAVQTLSITTGGTVVPLSATAATNTGGAWLSIAQSTFSSPALVTVAANPAGLPPGTYSGSVTIAPAFNLPPVVVPVLLNIINRTGPAIAAVASGASFLPGPVSPGQIVTITGRDLGPATPSTYRLTANGTIDTQLADVRVLFDGIPAPLLYVLGTQINVVVPYGIGGRTTVRVEVEYRGVRSNAFDVAVAASAPGLFTVGGTTQGAILNQDNTLNGPQNGAQPGTIVSLYGTGEGITTPAGIEGAIVPPTALATPVLPVSVTIGGRPAEVLYAGSAPGLPAGVLQVNARVPLELAVGTSHPVVLTVGTAQSQAGVTVFIRP